ncbi:hypothetical protein PINS_up011172 [Pythium insidiosum]|nr:hypothetical protein PINS_up011172 [Pythium insidiosum]
MASDAMHKTLDGHAPTTATTASSNATTSESHLHYVRATSAIDGDGSSSGNKRAPTDYVARRWELWEAPHGTTTPAELGAIARLPLPLQVGFRRKMLSIFLLQLLLVGTVVGVFLFDARAQRVAERAFGRGREGYVVLAFLVGLALLVALYVSRNRFPLNWLLLLLFSAAQSACFVGLGVAADTNIGFFNCAFTFACVAIMTALAGVSRRKRLASPPAEGDEREETHEQEALLSSFYAGAIAYVVVAVISTLLFLSLGRDLVTDVGFGGTLGFQLLLLLWFASDAAAMYRVVTPDEYMHGVIYFYTDLILLAIAACIAVATVAAVAACATMCADGGDCSGCGGDCSGCIYIGNCYCPCTCDGGHPRDRPSDEEDGAMHRV